jgi:hypothetical protein
VPATCTPPRFHHAVLPPIRSPSWVLRWRDRHFVYLSCWRWSRIPPLLAWCPGAANLACRHQNVTSTSSPTSYKMLSCSSIFANLVFCYYCQILSNEHNVSIKVSYSMHQSAKEIPSSSFHALIYFGDGVVWLEMIVDFQLTTWCHVQEDGDPHNHREPIIWKAFRDLASWRYQLCLVYLNCQISFVPLTKPVHAVCVGFTSFCVVHIPLLQGILLFGHERVFSLF